MEHAALVGPFRDRTELARELIEPLGFAFAGDATVVTGEGDLTQAKPLLARADLGQVETGGRTRRVRREGPTMRRPKGAPPEACNRPGWSLGLTFVNAVGNASAFAIEVRSGSVGVAPAYGIRGHLHLSSGRRAGPGVEG